MNVKITISYIYKDFVILKMFYKSFDPHNNSMGQYLKSYFLQI